MRAFRFTDDRGVDIYLAVPWPDGSNCIPPHSIMFRWVPPSAGVRPFSYNGELQHEAVLVTHDAHIDEETP